MALTLVRPNGAYHGCHVTSREAMLFMKYEHYGKCKGSFKDLQRKCKYLYVNSSGSITSVGEERANLSAVVYL